MSPAGAEGAGRFAPSPTGPLHAGSLLAAVASYLDARSQGIAWQVRLDDLDEARHEPGADGEILFALERHGLYWDGPVVRQTERTDRYLAALEDLHIQGLLFYCRCSRRSLKQTTVYPGRCRRFRAPRPNSAIRVQVDDTRVELDDLMMGPQHWSLQAEGGDFVVRRRDGIIAYQLATAVDDGEPAITRVIRGRDLLETTAKQVYLMHRLGLSVPRYGHMRLIVDAAGQKLSKQTFAPPLDSGQPVANLMRTLKLLGLPNPPAGDNCEALLGWAVGHFDLSAIPAGDAVAS